MVSNKFKNGQGLMMVSIKVLVSLVVSDNSRRQEIPLSIISNNQLKKLKKMTNIKSNTGSEITLFRKVIRERNFNFKTSLPVIKKKKKKKTEKKQRVFVGESRQSPVMTNLFVRLHQQTKLSKVLLREDENNHGKF